MCACLLTRAWNQRAHADAIAHLTIFLASLARSTTWKRTVTDKSSSVQYLPTVCPGDCLVTFQRRVVPDGA